MATSHVVLNVIARSTFDEHVVVNGSLSMTMTMSPPLLTDETATAILIAVVLLL